VSIFDRLDAMTSATVDRLNAIPFTLTPMKAATANKRRSPDPERSAVTARGILDLDPYRPAIEAGNRAVGRGGANDFRSIVEGLAAVLSVDRGQFPAGGEPRQGDRVTFPGRPDLPEYEVITTRRDGLSRLEMALKAN